MQHGSMQHGSMQHGSMQHGSMQHGSMQHDMSHHGEHQMQGNHQHTKQESAVSQIDKTKYRFLKASVKTNDPHKPVDQTIEMALDGWMDRFIWFINGVPEHHAHPIVIEPNKRYRIIFKNLSMMHHPMHMHGHWFIMRAGHGEYDPLLHTIDMPPGATIIADVDGDESGQWLFHCHLLYHMMSGMSRVFQYSTLLSVTENKSAPEDFIQETPYHNRPIVRVDEIAPIDPKMIQHPMAHPNALQTFNQIMLGTDPFHDIQRMTYKGLFGSDYHKLMLFMNDSEMNQGRLENADLDVFYWYLFDQFWALKGGVNYFYRPSDSPYWQPGIGIEGTMPYFIETDARLYYHQGAVKFDIELDRDVQITNNFFIQAGIRSILATKTVAEDEIGSGLNQMRYTITPFYRVRPGLNIMMEYEHERDCGVLNIIKL
jgi:uncharacterized protein involved in copper resistance